MLRLKFSVILFLAVLLVGCGDNLNPIVSEDSNPQVEIEVQAIVLAEAKPDFVLGKIAGEECYEAWFLVSISNLGNKEITIDGSSFIINDVKGAVIYSQKEVFVFDYTSVESSIGTAMNYLLNSDNEITFVIKPKSTELVGLFTVVPLEPIGEWNLVYGNRQVVISVQKEIEQAVASGKEIGDDTKANGKDVPVVENGNKDNGDDKVQEPVIKEDAPMVLIPAGEFQMGTNTSDINTLAEEFMSEMGHGDFSEFKIADIKDPGWRDTIQQEWNGVLDVAKTETPAHEVFLDAFYIDVYEVTNAQYKKFIDATGHKAPDFWNSSAPNQPMVRVNWYDASAYAKWAGKRLPTEAEWEKAARGRLVGKKFPWGDQNPDGSQCNFGDRNASFSIGGIKYEIVGSIGGKKLIDGYEDTAPVGSFSPNGYGLYDMAGNVSEWCADWYDSRYYANSPRINPKGPDGGKEKVIRGGSCDAIPFLLRVAWRDKDTPDRPGYDRGFRCAMDAK